MISSNKELAKAQGVQKQVVVQSLFPIQRFPPTTC